LVKLEIIDILRSMAIDAAKKSKSILRHLGQGHKGDYKRR
jgi:hypothetical protein